MWAYLDMYLLYVVINPFLPALVTWISNLPYLAILDLWQYLVVCENFKCLWPCQLTKNNGMHTNRKQILDQILDSSNQIEILD